MAGHSYVELHEHTFSYSPHSGKTSNYKKIKLKNDAKVFYRERPFAPFQLPLYLSNCETFPAEQITNFIAFETKSSPYIVLSYACAKVKVLE